MELKTIQDINGSDYYVVDVDSYDDDAMGKNFIKIILDFNLRIEEGNNFNKKLLERNNDSYHITVLSVPEYNKCKSKFKTGSLPQNLPMQDVIFKGIGSISKDDKTTYFVVCESKTVDEFREMLGLDPKDLHITIGFTDKDLFHDRKNNPNIINY